MAVEKHKHNIIIDSNIQNALRNTFFRIKIIGYKRVNSWQSLVTSSRNKSKVTSTEMRFLRRI